VEEAVAAVADRSKRLRRTGGKKIHELRPDIDWDKGRAVTWLLGELGLGDPDVLPIYVGDDETDEDAFR
jgi:trehalose-phosphatase